MSDTSILPGGDLPPSGGSGEGPPGNGFDEPGDGDRRRLLLIGGAAAVVILLIVVVFFVLKGNGGSSGPTGAVPRGTPRAALTTPSPSPSSASSAKGGHSLVGTKVPKKTHTVLVTDPFKPLFSVSTTGQGVGSVNVHGGSGGFSFPSGPSSGGAPTAAPAIAGPPLWIELIRTNSSSSAVFDVGYAHGKKYRFDVSAPAPSSVQGTVFDEEFALLGIQNGEATVQVGDATPFDLRPGVSHPV